MDSYPQELGRHVWTEAKERGVGKLIAELQDCWGWTDLYGKGTCPYCGQRVLKGCNYNIRYVLDGDVTEEGLRQRITTHLSLREEDRGRGKQMRNWNESIRWERRALVNLRKRGYPDPRRLMHNHGEGAVNHINPFEDALWMEWVYVLDPDENQIDVWHFVNGQKANPELHGSGVFDGHGYTHLMVGRWRLDQELDFALLEETYRILIHPREMWEGRIERVDPLRQEEVRCWLTVWQPETDSVED